MVNRTRRKATELEIRQLLHGNIEVRDLVRIDTFTGWMMLQFPVPRPGINSPKGFVTRPWRDEDTTAFMEFLHGEGYDKVNAAGVDRAIALEGWSKRFSSAEQALLHLPLWDGVPRMATFFIDVCGVQADSRAHEDYLHAVARCFFIGVIARILSPGCKLDTMLVLEGPQGIGKSMLLRRLALRDEWFSDGMILDVASKDAKQHLPGKLIIELAEVAQFKRSSIEALKSFLSAQDDKFRPSYGRHEIINPRQCVFVGTTNEGEYLKDETGNRRFWPMRCGGGPINLKLAEQLIPLCYAEAYDAFHKNEPHYLTGSVLKAAEEEQRSRLEGDVWEETIVNAIQVARSQAKAMGHKEFWMSTTELLSLIFADEDGAHHMERWTRAHESRVGIIMAKHGGIRRQLRVGGRQVWRRRFNT